MASAAKYQFQNNQDAFTGDYHVVCPQISPCLETQRGGLRHPDTQAYAVCPALTASMSKPLGYGGKDDFIALGCGSKGGQASVAVAFGGDVARTLSARHDSSPCADRGMDVVADQWAVRRLTPTECERLQGFRDGYTAIPWRGKPADQCPDGPRYKALGNSMAVPVMNWIGRRINLIEDIAP